MTTHPPIDEREAFEQRVLTRFMLASKEGDDSLRDFARIAASEFDFAMRQHTSPDTGVEIRKDRVCIAGKWYVPVDEADDPHRHCNPDTSLPSVERALRWLVALKEHKDQHGKDAYYEFEQPIAWRMAKDALRGVSSEISVVEERIKEILERYYVYDKASGSRFFSISDAMEEIRPYLATRKPVSVDLDDVTLWKEHKTRQQSDISHYEYRKIFRQILDAAGLKHAE